MKMKIVLVVVILAILAMVSFHLFRPKAEADTVVPPVVKVEQPEISTIELSTGLIGKVEPSDVVYIMPKAAGVVTQVLVKAGDTVEEGQPICTIDTKQVDSAKLNMEAASITLNDARNNLARMTVLYESGDISAQAFEQVQSGVRSAQIQYNGARLAYNTQMEFSHITAPIGGTVESVDIEVHDTVTQQNQLFVIAGKGSKAVSFSVTERIRANIQEGNQIRIEKNGEEYTGTVSQVNSMVDAATGLIKVKAFVEDADALATGSAVKLYVTSEKAEDIVTVPIDALYYSSGDAFVYTYVDGMVSQVSVETGISDADRIHIVSGVTPKDQVIVTWSPELREGARVNLLDDQANVPLQTTAQ